MILYVMCGSPGAGKTTLSKKIAKNFNLIRLSFDELNCIHHNELIPHIINTLDNKKSIIVDALYTKEKWRIELLQAIKHIECQCILIYVDTSLDECIYRNMKRENKLPDFLIKSIYNSTELPTMEEGWDKIIYYKGE